MTPGPSLGFQRQIVLPVIVTLISLVIALLFFFDQYLASRVTARAEQSVLQVKNAWDGLQQENSQYLAWLTSEAGRDTALQDAMRRQDATALLAQAQPRYALLHKQFGVSHWYFITPGKQILLRVHNPKDAGDFPLRQTLHDAAASGLPVNGLELGATATLTLRHVMPWRIGGELLGYIEMGIEVDRFDKQINNLLGYEIASAVHKSFTTEKNYATGKQAFGFSGDWNTHAGFALLNQTLAVLPEGFVLAWQDVARGINPGTLMTQSNGRHWAGGFVQLHDMSERPVGSLAVLINMDAANASRSQQLVGMTAGALLVTLLLSAALAWRVRRIERQVQHAQATVRENEQRFQDFASAASDWWFWEMDANLRFSYFSPNAANAIGGRPIESILGLRRHDLVAELGTVEQEKWANHLAILDRHQAFHQYEYRIALPDGQYA